MGLSLTRLTAGRSNSEWMLQGDKIPTKTKEKGEVKTTGFKIKSGPESLVVQAAIIGRRLVGKHSGDTSSAHHKCLKTILGRGFLRNGAMEKCDKRWPLSLQHQWVAENWYVSSKMTLQAIMICVTFHVQLRRSA